MQKIDLAEHKEELKQNNPNFSSNLLLKRVKAKLRNAAQNDGSAPSKKIARQERLTPEQKKELRKVAKENGQDKLEQREKILKERRDKFYKGL